MENSTVVIILTLSHRLRKAMAALANENDDWLILPQCLLEWSAQQFVSRKQIKVEGPQLDLYNQFIGTYEEQLLKLNTDFNLQKAEWKAEELWLYFANQHGKHFPDWNEISSIKKPEIKDKTVEGTVIFHPKDSTVYYSEVSRMPRHAVVQAEEFLRMGIHSSKALQRAFDATPINLLASRFLLCKQQEKTWNVSKGFSTWWKDTRQGYPSIIEENTDDYGPQRQTKPQWRDKTKEARHKSKSNPDFKRKVKAGVKIYDNAFKCSLGESIAAREVYARCYSKRPEWTEWNFI